jgi:hypothetical protein
MCTNLGGTGTTFSALALVDGSDDGGGLGFLFLEVCNALRGAGRLLDGGGSHVKVFLSEDRD